MHKLGNTDLESIEGLHLTEQHFRFVDSPAVKQGLKTKTLSRDLSPGVPALPTSLWKGFYPKGDVERGMKNLPQPFSWSLIYYRAVTSN